MLFKLFLPLPPGSIAKQKLFFLNQPYKEVELALLCLTRLCGPERPPIHVYDVASAYGRIQRACSRTNIQTQIIVVDGDNELPPDIAEDLQANSVCNVLIVGAKVNVGHSLAWDLHEDAIRDLAWLPLEAFGAAVLRSYTKKGVLDAWPELLDGKARNDAGPTGSDAERYLRKLLSQEESQVLELKSSFSVALGRPAKAQDLEAATLKTIAAFMNTEGGLVILGVNDDRQIVGLDPDITKRGSYDKFLQHLQTRILQELGISALSKLIEINRIDSKGKDGLERTVCIITCRPASAPGIRLGRNSDFYIRKGNMTFKLKEDEIVLHFAANNASRPSS
jgi:hypothetical protein